MGYEKSIGDAFALGQVQIELAELGEANALHLLTRTADAAATTFATEAIAIPSMLAQHRRNLQLLRRQKANFDAGEEPLQLINQIAAEEKEIARLERELGSD